MSAARAPAQVLALPRRPDLLALKRACPARYPCLLESLARGQAPARYDLLFATSGERLELAAAGTLQLPDGSAAAAGSFLDALRAWQQQLGSTPMPTDELPFHGGWVLFLGYELAAEIEPRLRDLPAAGSGLPRALALRCPVALLHDHERELTLLVAEPGHEALAAQVLADLDGAAALLPVLPAHCSWDVAEAAPQPFLQGIARIQQYLAAGDTFQVNLSRPWQARSPAAVEPHALYARLRASNPAPFAGLLDCGNGSHLLCSSPERLVEVRGDRVQTRPIAGTRPRRPGDDSERDWLALPRDPKERAEHVMLIDLERNDLGRICLPGSVEVSELLGVESYAHVHHIVSNVRGRLRPGIDAVDVIRATFPGGTITGCPKLRSMQIIAELEGEGRGAYTGSLGYLDRSGELDLNILIRSMLLQGAALQFRTGAGIVVDSQPQRELEETRAKAEGLLRALR